MMKKQYLLYVMASLVWGTLFFACSEENADDSTSQTNDISQTNDEHLVINSSIVFDAAAIKTFEVAENDVMEIPIPEATVTNGRGYITYSITDGDNDEEPLFAIGGEESNHIVLAKGKSLDYEDTFNYTLTITATAGSLKKETVAITIYVMDVDEVVFDLSSPLRITYLENTWTNIPLPSATVDDDDFYDTFTYAISKRNDTVDILFAIGGDESNQIVLVSGKILDYENDSEITNYILTITATSSIDSSITGDLQVEITVEDVAEPPVIAVITGTTAFEEATTTTSTVLFDIDAVDPDTDDQTLTYAVESRYNLFMIDAMTGEIHFVVDPDYETVLHRSNDLTIKVIDDEGSIATTNITIYVTPKDDEAPVITSHSDEETIFTTPWDTNVLTFTAEDGDVPASSSITYVIGGTDGDTFTINASTGVLTFVDASADAVNDRSYDIVVTARDEAGNSSLPYRFTISLPAIIFSATEPTIFNVKETVTTLNIPIPTTTIRYGRGDEPPIVYAITGGNTDTTFEISPEGNEIVFADGKELDHESGVTNYDLIITATSSTYSITETITITVNVVDVDALAFNRSSQKTFFLSEDVDLSPGFVVDGVPQRGLLFYIPGARTDDPALNTVRPTYSITGGYNKDHFSLYVTGLYLSSGTILDYETQSNYTLRITATLGSITAHTNINIWVTDVDEPPIITDFQILNAEVGTVISFSNATNRNYSFYANSITIVGNIGSGEYYLFASDPEGIPSRNISYSFEGGVTSKTIGTGFDRIQVSLSYRSVFGNGNGITGQILTVKTTTAYKDGSVTLWISDGTSPHPRSYTLNIRKD